jgi:serine/threonine protein kinase
VKIVLPPNKSRILYFTSAEQQKEWSRQIRLVIGEHDIKDFYEMTTSLGKGQFGVVRLGKHRKSKEQVAIKTIVKSNMKPIEVLQ